MNSKKEEEEEDSFSVSEDGATCLIQSQITSVSKEGLLGENRGTNIATCNSDRENKLKSFQFERK